MCLLLLFVIIVFLFKQKTAYDMRISDWSSDVCSSDLSLFFLHGAFHIYKDGKSIKKITQQTDRALYDRLESILNDEEQEIVCVFQSENKLGAIGENAYLSKCYDSIGKLSGNLVILG